jgi:sugar/nucleoside kinase (ribokinase family)
MAERTIDVVAAGHLCLDMHPAFTNEPGVKIADLLRPGTLVRMGGMTFSTGGTVSNTGMAMKKFGLEVAFMAKVGDDPIGDTIIELIGKQGNAEGISVAGGEASSYTVVLSPAGIDRIFLHSPGTNDTFTAEDIDFSLVERARLFHLGYPTLMNALFANRGVELERIYKRAKECGVTTSMDISLPDPSSPAGKANWATIYERTLPHVDVYLPSIEEAFFTLDPGEYLGRKESHGGEELIDYVSPAEFSRIAATYIELGCGMIALKAGHLGWYFRTASARRLERLGTLRPANIEQWANRELWCPAFKVDKIASATGSGDSSIAAFLTALSRGCSPVDCLKYANCAGYLSLSGMDATSGLCGWEEMTAVMDSLRVGAVPALEHTDWRWDREARVWEREAGRQ